MNGRKYQLSQHPLNTKKIRAAYNTCNNTSTRSPGNRNIAQREPRKTEALEVPPPSFSLRGWRVLSRVVSMNKNLRPRVASRLTPILKLTLQPSGRARRSLFSTTLACTLLLLFLRRHYFILRWSIAKKSHGSQSAVAETRTYFRPSAHSPPTKEPTTSGPPLTARAIELRVRRFRLEIIMPRLKSS